MKRLKAAFGVLRRRWALSPEQAKTLSTIKFPCC